MSAAKLLKSLTRYKAWADERIFAMVRNLPPAEAMKPRATRYTNMIHTLTHVFVIDQVFQAHLQGRRHGFTSRNTTSHPPLHELESAVRILDAWYIEFVDQLTQVDLERTIEFEFIGGGRGSMSCLEMIVHVVNHGTYHRGLVADMMYQAGVTPDSTDLTVFLRDTPRPSSSAANPSPSPVPLQRM